MNLSIDLQNCYGIGAMKESIAFNNSVANIYAPNGTMKTSLTRTFENIRDGQLPKDLHYPNRITKCDVKVDGKPIDPSSVYIFKNEDYDGSASLNSLLADQKLKDEYDAIYSELNESKSNLTRNLKNIAKSSDCEEEIIDVFKENENDTFFDCLINIKKLLDGSIYHLYDFRYNDIFDKAGKVKKFIQDNNSIFQEYMCRYQEITKDSPLYTSGELPFGTTQASTLLKSVEDNRYFTANHVFKLKNGIEIKNKTELSDLIKSEVNRISEDEKLKKQFMKIDAALGKNSDLRAFKDELERNPDLVSKVLDYENFQREVLLGYMQQCQQDFETTIHTYEQKSAELREILKKANAQSEAWQDVVVLFNDRFFVPFKVLIENKADVLLKDQTVSLVFQYEDGEEPPVKESKDILVKTLSRGEQKAFFILQNLFSIEERKRSNQPTLLIFDDVADSFDYKNKYAIVEYLADLQQHPNFHLLILTHNFDFFRTVNSRLTPRGYFANKGKDRTVNLGLSIFKTDILDNLFFKKIQNKRSFLGLIPFVRNMYEYMKGQASYEYEFLTSCLHIKDGTSKIKLSEIKDIYGVFEMIKSQSINFGDELFKDALYAEADTILQEDHAQKTIDLADKLVLSMAIRLKAEEFMIAELNRVQCLINCDKYQTAVLFNNYKEKYPQKKNECLLINKVVMLTSENIHVNNFMFEPLIDISSVHLKKLYEDVKALNESAIVHS